MTSTNAYGITGFGGYIPRLRMERSAIAAAHKWMAPALRSAAKGRRAFCNWDEDSITMAVEAARDALNKKQPGDIAKVVLASTTMPFADMLNASVVCGALDLPAEVRALDIGQTQRAGTSALLAALVEGGKPALVVASDRPRGKPASTQEIGFGAGAAAFTLGSKNVVADFLGFSSSTASFVDHFRSNDNKYDYFWEERWIRDEGYLKIAPPVAVAALANAGVRAGDIAHFIMPTPFKGVSSALSKKLGLPAGCEADGLEEHCGYTGAAHALLMLSNVLQACKPGELILVMGFGQGCDALVFRATDAIGSFQPVRGVAGALADAQSQDNYLRMLAYDEGIELEWGMRAEKNTKTSLTEQYRSSGQIAGFVAGKCRKCGTVQFPQLAYCVAPSCHAGSENFEPIPLRDVPCKVLTHTADWLSYHPAPPLYVGFVQFENGARLLMETVDVSAQALEKDMPLRVVYRIKEIDKTRGYRRYFWKTTPI
ncbi:MULTISPECIES: hydroxymethylglutaryl-CoA synthase family protein [Polaromonas]|uniref:Hydroxymethylglutaryl-CoA synthase family protein n=1 Tax=Polaromonas aquatica TaxID=332657 RepID=A0ABW1U207_9BURK